MPDIYLFAGQVNPNDVRLTNPSAPPVIGTSALTQASATIAAAGLEVFTGTSSLTQASATIAAAGLEVFTGTSSLTQASATIAAAGLEVFTGTSSLTQTAATIAAAGLEKFLGTSALTQSAHTSAAAAIAVFTGTAALTQSAATIAAAGLAVAATSSFVIAGGGIRGAKTKRPYRWGKKAPEPISGQAHLEQAAHSIVSEGRVTRAPDSIPASISDSILNFQSPARSRMGLAELAPPIVRIALAPPIPVAAAVYVVQSRHTMRARGSMSTERLELEEALCCLLLLTAANSQK